MADDDVNLKGLPEEFVAHSKINSKLDKGADVGNFSTLKPEGERISKNYEPSASSIDGTKFDRFHDTEAKILEDIATKIKDPNTSGSIDLFTELPACQSCSNIILEFRKKFPNIASSKLQLNWISIIETGMGIEKEDLPLILKELKLVKEWIEKNVTNLDAKISLEERIE